MQRQFAAVIHFQLGHGRENVLVDRCVFILEQPVDILAHIVQVLLPDPLHELLGGLSAHTRHPINDLLPIVHENERGHPDPRDRVQAQRGVVGLSRVEHDQVAGNDWRDKLEAETNRVGDFARTVGLKVFLYVLIDDFWVILVEKDQCMAASVRIDEAYDQEDAQVENVQAYSPLVWHRELEPSDNLADTNQPVDIDREWDNYDEQETEHCQEEVDRGKD